MKTLRQEAEQDVWARPGEPIAEVLLYHDNIYIETRSGERWRIVFGDTQTRMTAEKIK